MTKTIALIDADLVAYRSSASCEPNKNKAEREDLEFAVARARDMMERILHATNPISFKAYLTGSDNFRYGICSNYKANRKDMVRPQWLQPVREYLVQEWGANVCDSIEADDAIGIDSSIEECIICSIDKDLLQLSGHHYNFVKELFTFVSPREALANFYTQLLLGDRSDNIQGFDGKMRTSIPKFLQPYVDAIRSCTSEYEMYQVVHDIYELGDEDLIKNGRLLYILRKHDDMWNPPSSEVNSNLE